MFEKYKDVTCRTALFLRKQNFSNSRKQLSLYVHTLLMNYSVGLFGKQSGLELWLC